MSLAPPAVKGMTSVTGRTGKSAAIAPEVAAPAPRRSERMRARLRACAWLFPSLLFDRGCRLYFRPVGVLPVRASSSPATEDGLHLAARHDTLKRRRQLMNVAQSSPGIPLRLRERHVHVAARQRVAPLLREIAPRDVTTPAVAARMVDPPREAFTAAGGDGDPSPATIRVLSLDLVVDADDECATGGRDKSGPRRLPEKGWSLNVSPPRVSAAATMSCTQMSCMSRSSTTRMAFRGIPIWIELIASAGIACWATNSIAASTGVWIG